jgi:hypothetical protein
MSQIEAIAHSQVKQLTAAELIESFVKARIEHAPNKPLSRLFTAVSPIIIICR